MGVLCLEFDERSIREKPVTAKTVRISADVVHQELEDQTVLVDLKTDCYFSLDDVGTRMWQLLVEHGDPESVVAALRAEYEADEAVLRRDLSALVAELGKAGLVSVD